MAKVGKKKMAAKKVEETVEQQVAEEQAPEQEQAPNMTIQDIQAAAQVIDAAVRRGAFTAAEAGAVGGVYTKLVTFLQHVAPHLFEQGEGDQDEE